MIIIGIDPGLSGGIGIIPLYDFYRSTAYALTNLTLTDLHLLLQQYRTGESIFNDDTDKNIDTPVTIFLEEPQLPQFNKHTGNNFNVQAHKKLARSIGQIEGICIANGYPPILVAPTRWQGFLNCKTGGDKKVSYGIAQSIFNHHKRITSKGDSKSTITHATADALLIALYGYLQYATKIPLCVSRVINTKSHLPHEQPKKLVFK